MVEQLFLGREEFAYNILNFYYRRPCVHKFLELYLNESSTGMCILVLATERFILTEFPFRAKIILQRRNRIIIYSSVLVILILTSGLFFVNHEKALLGNIVNTDRTCIHSRSEQFQASIFWLKVIFYYLLPATLAFVMYVRIILTLLNSKRNQTRNVNLSIAFCISYFSWILLWLPRYWVRFMEKYYLEHIVVNVQWLHNLSKYQLVEAIMVSYSWMNPIILLIVLRPFSEWITRLSRCIYKIF